MTDTENKTPAKKKGGARPGAGRKPLIGAKTTTVILTEDLLIQLKRLGGSSWIRSQNCSHDKTVSDKKLQMMFSIRSPSLQKRSLWKRPPIIQWIEPEFMREPFFFSERKQKPRSAISFFLNTQGKKALRRFTASERGFRLVPESSDSGLTDFILPRGAELAHSGIVVYVLSEPK